MTVFTCNLLLVTCNLTYINNEESFGPEDNSEAIVYNNSIYLMLGVFALAVLTFVSTIGFVVLRESRMLSRFPLLAADGPPASP